MLDRGKGCSTSSSVASNEKGGGKAHQPAPRKRSHPIVDPFFQKENFVNGEPIQETAIDLIDSEPQVRKSFREESLEELTSQIKRHGLLQPIVLRGLEIGSKSSSAGVASWRPNGPVVERSRRGSSKRT